MTDHLTIRALEQGDLAALAPILDRTGLFPSDLLPDMAKPYLSGVAPHQWLVAEAGESIAGFVYCEPERMTDGTFNLLAVAVLPDAQCRGIGGRLIAALEEQLRASGGRVIIVETSSLDEYRRTRAFYDREGFTREARIRDFYQADEDKIIFWKRL